jgi:glutaminyl-peptide cyclotransferase
LRFAGKHLALLAVLVCGNLTARAFDEARAFLDLEVQTAFGPRNPGSPGHDQCRDYLVRELTTWADTVWTQPFSYTSRDTRATLSLTNIIARFSPTQHKRVLLCAHWDTRPFADRDSDPANRQTPILGANDGASGVAILLEVARSLYQDPVDVGVDLVLFDGEDYGREGEIADYLIGSKYFAKNMPAPLPQFAVLLDMVGDRDLHFPIEDYSQRYAHNAVEKIWKAADRQKAAAFTRAAGSAIMDDHTSLIEAGIPAVDIIDFDYPYWHTLGDVPERCSPQSLGQVGRTLLDMLQHEGPLK